MADVTPIRTAPVRYWELVDPYWEKVSIYDGPEVFLRDFAAVPPESGHLLATHRLASEVHNGGFDQFFANSTGVLAPEALAGFRTLGLDDAAFVVGRAMSVFGEAYLRDQDEREAVLEALEANYAEAGEKMPMLWDEDDQVIWEMLQSGRFDRVADAYATNVINRA